MIRNKSDIVESSGAYKDINIVLENQSNLVEKIIELKSLATLKR